LLIVPDSGHSALEEGTVDGLRRAVEKFKID
jgi:hypothetical protein